MCSCRGGDEMVTCEVHVRKVLESLAERHGRDRTLGELMMGAEPEQRFLFPKVEPRPDRTSLGAKAAILLFCRLWTERRGGQYVPSWGRDGAAWKRLVQATGATQDELERRMRIALDDLRFQARGNFAAFCSQWSNYDRPVDARGRLLPAPQETRKVIGFDASTGGLKYGQ